MLGETPRIEAAVKRMRKVEEARQQLARTLAALRPLETERATLAARVEAFGADHARIERELAAARAAVERASALPDLQRKIATRRAVIAAAEAEMADWQERVRDLQTAVAAEDERARRADRLAEQIAEHRRRAGLLGGLEEPRALSAAGAHSRPTRTPQRGGPPNSRRRLIRSTLRIADRKRSGPGRWTASRRSSATSAKRRRS